MKKALVISALGVAAIGLAGCKSCNLEQKKQEPNATVAQTQKQMVGGWYPVFFNKYEQKKVDSIIKAITDNKAKRITITYDDNKQLAEKILEAIQSQLNFAVEMEHVSPKDGSAKFDHSKVVVTVYQK
jgi:endonuclease G, mitochondrial